MNKSSWSINGKLLKLNLPTYKGAWCQKVNENKLRNVKLFLFRQDNNPWLDWLIKRQAVSAKNYDLDPNMYLVFHRFFGGGVQYEKLSQIRVKKHLIKSIGLLK